jgi:hypothetical protein
MKEGTCGTCEKYKALVGKYGAKGQFWRLGLRCKNKLQIDLKGLFCLCADCIQLAQHTRMFQWLTNLNMVMNPPDSIKDGNI